MKRILSAILTLVICSAAAQNFQCGDSLTDPRDGQKYSTVSIGSQCWMEQNLNYGTMIIDTAFQSNNEVVEKYCYDNLSGNCDTLGGLYMWYEMMGYSTEEGTEGICPEGWHLPSDMEWRQLEVHMGMDAEEAALNNSFRGEGLAPLFLEGGESGFNAKYSGVWNGSTFIFDGQNELTLFWTSTLDSLNGSPWRRGFYDNETSIWRGSGNTSASPSYGYCVRCVSNSSTLSDGLPDSELKTFTVFPNPTNGLLNIQRKAGDQGSLFAEIIDGRGKVMKQQRIVNDRTTIDISDLDNGMYILRLLGPKGSETHKVIKNR